MDCYCVYCYEGWGQHLHFLEKLSSFSVNTAKLTNYNFFKNQNLLKLQNLRSCNERSYNEETSVTDITKCGTTILHITKQ